MTTNNDNATAIMTTTEEERIEKAVMFWRHPSLSNVSPQDKMEYLKSKGLSSEDIHRVWEKIAEDVPSPDSIRNIPATPVMMAAPPVANEGFVDDVEDPYSTMALLAVGSALGLTAAAAVRWLNGGDFYIFPPASTTTTTISSKPDEYCTVEEERISRADTIDQEEHSQISSCHENELSQQIKELTGLVKGQSETQERILKQLTSVKTKHFTDDSMALLRPSPAQELLEIKTLLEASSPSSAADEKIKQALAKLNAYIGESAKNAPAENVASVALVNIDDTIPSSDGVLNELKNHLRQALEQLILENNSEERQMGCQVLYLYVFHLSSHPHVPRYRKIFTANDSFQKVEKLKGGVELLLAVGFVKNEGGYLEWQPENEKDTAKMLRDASSALSLMKANHEEQGDESLLQAVKVTLGEAQHDPQTPQNNLLVSPPTTKSTWEANRDMEGVRQLFDDASSSFKPLVDGIEKKEMTNISH